MSPSGTSVDRRGDHGREPHRRTACRAGPEREDERSARAGRRARRARRQPVDALSGAATSGGGTCAPRRRASRSSSLRRPRSPSRCRLPRRRRSRRGPRLRRPCPPPATRRSGSTRRSAGSRPRPRCRRRRSDLRARADEVAVDHLVTSTVALGPVRTTLATGLTSAASRSSAFFARISCNEPIPRSRRRRRERARPRARRARPSTRPEPSRMLFGSVKRLRGRCSQYERLVGGFPGLPRAADASAASSSVRPRCRSGAVSVGGWRSSVKRCGPSIQSRRGAGRYPVAASRSTSAAHDLIPPGRRRDVPRLRRPRLDLPLARARRARLPGRRAARQPRACAARSRRRTRASAASVLGAEVVEAPGAGLGEAELRELRYAVAADRLRATGHTASDQVETILYRLVSSGTADGHPRPARRRRRPAPPLPSGARRPRPTAARRACRSGSTRPTRTRSAA